MVEFGRIEICMRSGNLAEIRDKALTGVRRRFLEETMADFVENGAEENPHAALDPLQSTRVIHQHVTAGIELARREHLPERLIRFIPEHHGTAPMAFFLDRARRTAVTPDNPAFYCVSIVCGDMPLSEIRHISL